MFESLQTNLAKHDSPTKIRAFPNIFAEVAAKIETEQLLDSIIYINVLEHIEDDQMELEIIHRTLREKGRVFVFVRLCPCFSVNLTKKSDISDVTEKPNSRKNFAPSVFAFYYRAISTQPEFFHGC